MPTARGGLGAAAGQAIRSTLGSVVNTATEASAAAWDAGKKLAKGGGLMLDGTAKMLSPVGTFARTLATGDATPVRWGEDSPETPEIQTPRADVPVSSINEQLAARYPAIVGSSRDRAPKIEPPGESAPAPANAPKIIAPQSPGRLTSQDYIDGRGVVASGQGLVRKSDGTVTTFGGLDVADATYQMPGGRGAREQRNAELSGQSAFMPGRFDGESVYRPITDDEAQNIKQYRRHPDGTVEMTLNRHGKVPLEIVSQPPTAKQQEERDRGWMRQLQMQEQQTRLEHAQSQQRSTVGMEKLRNEFAGLDDGNDPEGARRQALGRQIDIMGGKHDASAWDVKTVMGPADPLTGQAAKTTMAVHRFLTRPDGMPLVREIGDKAPTQVSSASAIPPEQRKVNQVYDTPKGKMIWTGNGWKPATARGN